MSKDLDRKFDHFKPKKGEERKEDAKKVTSKPVKAQNKVPEKAAEPERPSNPYKQATKKFLIAERLLAGETDREKIANEIGVEMHTVYTVASDLRKHHYRLKLDVKTPESSSGSHGSSGATYSPGDIAHHISSDSSQESMSPGDVENEGDVSSEDTPQGLPTAGSNKKGSENIRDAYRGGPQRDGISSETVEAIARRVFELMNPANKPQEQLPGIELPVEDVELVGEKVNYKIALNTEIFYRYSIFKARAASLGNKWDGTLSDFLDLATKDILTVYGLYPTVLTTSRAGKIMVEIPQNLAGVD